MLLALTPESSGALRTSAAVVERALYEAIQHGDDRQASQVYASLLPPVQATLLRVLGGPYRNHSELTQRSIEHVILELSRQPNPWACRLEAWATTAAARVALDVLRVASQANDVEVSWGEAMSRPGVHDGHGASAGTAIERLRWLLVELPKQQAEAVVLCDVMGLDAADAAVTLHTGIEHVRRLLSAGHERLARQMSASGRS